MPNSPADSTVSGSYSNALARLRSAARFGINPSLDGIRALCSAMGDPQDAFGAIQITGTNGKTSTARLAAAMLRHSGATVGLYTSPELERYPERIEIDGRPVSDREFATGVDAAFDAAESLGGAVVPTEFELLTAAACWLFRERGVDAAVLEVGMGGRWDATSVVSPRVAVITTVDLDHVEVLGRTVEAIAAEKAAIVARASVAVLGGLAEPAERVVLDAVRQAAVALVRPESCLIARPETPDGMTRFSVSTSRGEYPDLMIPAPAYQMLNAACAIAAVEEFMTSSLDQCTVSRALASVTFPGRFEVLARDPFLIVDGSHNPQAAETLARAIADAWPDPSLRPRIVLGVLSDKDAHGIVAALAPVASEIAVTTPESPRALPAERLADVVEAVTGRRPLGFATPKDALDAWAGIHDILITGSLTTAGQARAAFRARLS